MPRPKISWSYFLVAEEDNVNEQTHIKIQTRLRNICIFLLLFVNTVKKKSTLFWPWYYMFSFIDNNSINAHKTWILVFRKYDR